MLIIIKIINKAELNCQDFKVVFKHTDDSISLFHLNLPQLFFFFCFFLDNFFFLPFPFSLPFFIACQEGMMILTNFFNLFECKDKFFGHGNLPNQSSQQADMAGKEEEIFPVIATFCTLY